MPPIVRKLTLTLLLPCSLPAADLPPPAARAVDFAKDIQPLFEAACIKCHARGKDKGGFSMETRERFLKGGETDAGAVVGDSAHSYIVELVASGDTTTVMPKKGTKWTAEQIGILRAWIDQGAIWPAGITFAKPPAKNLQPRVVKVSDRPSVHPIDNLLATYFAEHGVAFPGPVDDRTFARRAYLDLVGLLPTPEQLSAFLADSAGDKRVQLVRSLLARQRDYADHWLAFWNDLLRNDYKGVGFIDGGRKQITRWLYQSLVTNKPYDRFVNELVNPTGQSEGFSRGIIWRGNVNASMLPPMQAAQNISQVFMGVNLKCASCHDSFTNDWSLADAYGVAAIYADHSLELVECDKPTGRTSAARFLYPQLGPLDSAAPKERRLARLAELLTARENGRLSRTLVNRLWARLFGRGLVEPLDDMEKPAWSRDVLDWLAEDFVAHGYDVKHTLEMLCTSRAYQLPAVEAPGEKETFVFRGPFTRRLSAEQLADAVSSLTGQWARMPSTLEFDFISTGLVNDVQLPKWIWTAEPVEAGFRRGALRTARSQLESAIKWLDDARAKTAAAAESGEAGTIGQAGTATRRVSTAVGSAQTSIDSAAQPPPAPAAGQVIPESERHKVIFRKKVVLTETPIDAYATILASQRFEVQVNGNVAKPILRDGFRNSRIALLNLKPLLVAGENIIAIDVSSHTEKQMNDSERKQYPASVTHLNARGGMAFYLRCSMRDGTAVQLGTDESWRVRRNPEGAWNSFGVDDAGWLTARPLPAKVPPVDEGPSLEPITRRDFANMAVELGPQLLPAVGIAAQPGRIRAGLIEADPLQVALDRPNREIVTASRNSAATTIQALELTNGSILNGRLQQASSALAAEATKDPAGWSARVFEHALGRVPTRPERELIAELLGAQPQPESVADFLWALVNLPEFQMIN